MTTHVSEWPLGYGPNHCTYAGAKALARRIEDHWRLRGVRVVAYVEPVPVHGVWTVRSDGVAARCHAPMARPERVRKAALAEA
jgi:hypothetical protein